MNVIPSSKSVKKFSFTRMESRFLKKIMEDSSETGLALMRILFKATLHSRISESDFHKIILIAFFLIEADKRHPSTKGVPNE
jgi:hypothetical protein